jgi:hypothetical protein
MGNACSKRGTAGAGTGAAPAGGTEALLAIINTSRRGAVFCPTTNAANARPASAAPLRSGRRLRVSDS